MIQFEIGVGILCQHGKAITSPNIQRMSKRMNQPENAVGMLGEACPVSAIHDCELLFVLAQRRHKAAMVDQFFHRAVISPSFRAHAKFATRVWLLAHVVDLMLSINRLKGCQSGASA